MLRKVGMAALCATTASAVSLREIFNSIQRHIVESNNGIDVQDVLVTADDNGKLDDTVTITRNDDLQEDGECELMMTEEKDEETGEIRQVYVSDCSDLKAEEYKKEFKNIMDRTKRLNKKYTSAREGRTPWTLGGRSFRKQTQSEEMQSKIQRVRIAAKPATAPAFTRVNLQDRSSLIARLRELYGKNKRLYTLTPRASNVDHSNYRY